MADKVPGAMVESFVPILSIMPDFGSGPFLWLSDQPEERAIGGNICDAVSWDPSVPLSEPLWELFAIWSGSFELAGVTSKEFEENGWDWSAFHERGLYLARRLKQEVGDDFRVVYIKPYEDPDHLVDERQEIRPAGGR